MEQSTITFRRAVDDDLPYVQQMVVDLCSELGLPVVREHCELAIANNWANPNARCFVAVKDKPIGVAAFVLSPELYNFDIICAHEAFWYVEPEFRGKAGVRLIRYVEKNLNCAIIDFGITDIRLQQLLLRSGYRELKTILRKEICVQD